MGLAHSPNTVTDGLVLCLDAANRRSYSGVGTAWNDLSGNGNNGMLINGPTFNNSSAGGIVLDGTDDYISINNMSNYQLKSINHITVDIWFKSNSFAGFSRKYIFENRDTNTNNPFPIFVDRTSDTSGSMKIYNNADTIVQTVYTNITYNVCYIIDTTVTLNNILFYVNGYKSVYSYNVSHPINSSNIMYLGRAYPSSSYRWNGPIYKFSLYNKILSDKDVLQNFNATRGRFGI